MARTPLPAITEDLVRPHEMIMGMIEVDRQNRAELATAYHAAVGQQVILNRKFSDIETRLSSLESSSSLTAGGSTAGAPVVVTPSGTIDGANNVFTLPFVPSGMILTKNGQVLVEGIGYTSLVTTITLTLAPKAAIGAQPADTLRAWCWA